MTITVKEMDELVAHAYEALNSRWLADEAIKAAAQKHGVPEFSLDHLVWHRANKQALGAGGEDKVHAGGVRGGRDGPPRSGDPLPEWENK